jgi:hypothetical protein
MLLSNGALLEHCCGRRTRAEAQQEREVAEIDDATAEFTYNAIVVGFHFLVEFIAL